MSANWNAFDIALVTASTFPECLADEKFLARGARRSGPEGRARHLG